MHGRYGTFKLEEMSSENIQWMRLVVIDGGRQRARVENI